MFTPDDIITGEKIQQLCDVYCGLQEDFSYNPKILQQSAKHFYIDRLEAPWDNPRLIFCYGWRLAIFMTKVNLLKNPFVLVSHNSDENVKEHFRPLADSPLLIRWYTQNCMLKHEKVEMIPIGVANSMWAHGRLDVYPQLNVTNKLHDVYFNFTVNTNFRERTLCRALIEQTGLVFMNHSLPIYSYLTLLSTYKFAICPPGNGIDCHRMWECYYCNVIPIIIDNEWATALKAKFPCIVLKSWAEFNKAACLEQYDTLLEELKQKRHLLCFNNLKEEINVSLTVTHVYFFTDF